MKHWNHSQALAVRPRAGYFSVLFLLAGWLALPSPLRADSPPTYLYEIDSSAVPGGFKPAYVALDSSNDVYVTDHNNNRVVKLAGNGTYLTQWGGYGSGNGQFLSPEGVAVDSSNNVYVADSWGSRVQKFDRNGNYLTQCGSSGTGNGQFLSPEGVAVDSSNNVYVADLENYRIEKFDSNGNYLTQWGSQGSGNGQFVYPIGVAVDRSNNVYVTDYNNRVQKFDSNGNYLTQWGSSGTGNGQFNYPAGVAVDRSNNVYVVDYYNSRVEKFGSNGDYLTQWGSSGTGHGQFNYPAGVAVDQSGNFIYVADYENYRIQVFVNNANIVPPIIISQPTNQTVLAGIGGINVTFSVSVVGTAPFAYQWTSNNVAVPGATNASFTLTNVGLSANGIYALLVTNNNGTALSSNAVLTVLPAFVNTLPASAITATGAVLNGSVTLGPDETLAWFEWGTDINYGQIDGVTDIPGSSGTVTFTNALTGLDGDLIYHYRVVAWNSFGIVYGADQSFQVGLRPTAASLGATGITTNSAALNAAINPGGRHTTVWFQWGTNTSYGNVTPVTSVGSGAASLNFSNVISGLSLNTLYHCQVVASNSLGQVTGEDVTFLFGAPLAVTEPATSVTGTNARINGLVTPNLIATTAWFEWGTNTSYGNTAMLGDMGSGGSALSANSFLNGLDPTVTYHFRLVASNAVGMAFGTDLKFNMSLDAYAQSVLADQPLVYYRFDEASGGIALNSGSLGAAANGTYNASVSLGNPSLVPAFGFAAGFNNSNSAVAVPALGSYSQFTIELWAKPKSFGVTSPGNPPHAAYNSIYTADTWAAGALHTHFVNLSGHYRQWQLAINGNNPLEVYAGNPVPIPTINSGFFPTNAWVHLAATYDSTARIMITYVNGHAFSTNIYSTAIPLNLAAAHIGAWIGTSSTPNWFDGGLDEFAIYGTALPASRIQAHYEAAIGNPVLLAAQATNKLTLSWIGPGFRLQSNPDLANAGGWTNVIGGSNSPVSVTISNAGNQFFRLSWP